MRQNAVRDSLKLLVKFSLIILLLPSYSSFIKCIKLIQNEDREVFSGFQGNLAEVSEVLSQARKSLVLWHLEFKIYTPVDPILIVKPLGSGSTRPSCG